MGEGRVDLWAVSGTGGMSANLALGRQCCYVALKVLAGPTPAVDQHDDRPFAACCFISKLRAIIGGEALSARHGWIQNNQQRLC